MTIGAAIHPTSLYAALNAFLILVVLLWLDSLNQIRSSLLAVLLIYMERWARKA